MYPNIRSATEALVHGFDAIRTDMIEKLMATDPDDWSEVTMPSCGDRVYVFDKDEEGEIREIDVDGDYLIKMDDGFTICRSADAFDVDRYDAMPMWGTMWSFDDPCDIHWMEEEDGVRVMSELGFRVYYHEEWGYFFGIDGAGFDFYEAYWIPLYKKRGLHWHDSEE